MKMIHGNRYFLILIKTVGPNYRYIDREDQNDDINKKWDAIEYDTDQDGEWDHIQELKS